MNTIRREISPQIRVLDAAAGLVEYVASDATVAYRDGILEDSDLLRYPPLRRALESAQGTPRRSYSFSPAAVRPATPTVMKKSFLDSIDAVANLRDLGQVHFINVASPGAKRPAWRIDRASLAAFEASRKSKPQP